MANKTLFSSALAKFSPRAAASTEAPRLTGRANPHQGDVDELLDELRPVCASASASRSRSRPTNS